MTTSVVRKGSSAARPDTRVTAYIDFRRRENDRAALRTRNDEAYAAEEPSISQTLSSRINDLMYKRPHVRLFPTALAARMFEQQLAEEILPRVKTTFSATPLRAIHRVMRYDFRVFFENQRNAPATVRQQRRRRTPRSITRHARPSPKQISRAPMHRRVPAASAPTPLRPVLANIGTQLYRARGIRTRLDPTSPPFRRVSRAARYRDQLAACINRLSDPETFQPLRACSRKRLRDDHSLRRADIEEGRFTVSLLDMLPDAGKLIEQTRRSPLSRIGDVPRAVRPEPLRPLTSPLHEESLAHRDLFSPPHTAPQPAS